ncbi:MAG: leucine--tRNA ligase [archaeon]
MVEADFKKIDEKWQKEWEKAGIFNSKDSKGKKFYVLEMFPYPSASGLHMGHAFNYTIGDIYARFSRMNGFNVLYPMGYDSLGLPAENAAIKEKVKPKEYTEKAIENFIRQQKALGLSYDWNRMVKTHDSEYSKWDQWIFLKMLEKGIAFRKKSPVNYCSKCETVLANEQVHDGKCWRHKDTNVEIKHLEQWFFRITDYADELYEGLDKLKEWPEDVKAMQRNWIGKSLGVEIDFEINSKKWKIFTTRADTIFGVTFMVVSSQHPLLMELVAEKQKKQVQAFLKKIKSTSEKDTELEKEGVFTGSYAINPLTQEKVPVYAGNFVVADYGSGMVMAVPCHDARDFEFAKKYKIPMKAVVHSEDEGLLDGVAGIKEAFTEDGILVNSGKFSGLKSSAARKEIAKSLAKEKSGREVVQFKLRDWLISRQRYWGTPIPIVYCEKCGIVPVPYKALPVKLPEKVEFGKGNPLATNKEFMNVKCPKCNGNAKRETDTMDTFVNSSWYFLRYCDSKNAKEIFDKAKVKYWMPVDTYIGGKEHACMHLIYFRFYTKFMRDMKLLDFDEPVLKLFNQGMVHGPDGAVMSKSKGNVVDPLEMVLKYGADTLRFYLVSNASADKDFIWSEESIEGSYRFINKVMNYFSSVKIGKSKELVESKFNSAVKRISGHVEQFEYNLALIELRQLFESLSSEESKKVLEGFLKLFCIFCPHISEELWHNFGNKTFISIEKFPKADESKINENLEKQEEQVEKTILDIRNITKIIKEKGGKAEKIYLYVLPKELELYKESKEAIEKSLNIPAEIYSVSDKAKYDPQNKSGKAKPGKPAIYIE